MDSGNGGFDTNEWSGYVSNLQGGAVQTIEDVNPQTNEAAATSGFSGNGVVVWLCVLTVLVISIAIFLSHIARLNQSELSDSQQTKPKPDDSSKQQI